MIPLARRTLLRMGGLALLPAALSACSSDEPVGSFPPLRYDYLTPLRLNVAGFDIDQRWVARTDVGDVAPLSPVLPVEALRQMAQDRLRPVGSAGRAVFVIQDASILEAAGQYHGTLAVRLEITTTGGTPAAYAETTVRRERDIDDGSGQRQALYDLTKRMMDDMNIEFEYQVRHSLRDWLQTPTTSTPDAVPAPVQAQPLPPPS